MHCEDAIELLSARLDGEITSEENTALERHLAQCEPCRAVEREFAALSELLPQALEVTPPPELMETVLANLPPQKQVKPILRLHWQRWSAAAAAFALVALAAWQLPRHYSTTFPVEAVAEESQLPSDDISVASAEAGTGDIPAFEDIEDTSASYSPRSAAKQSVSKDFTSEPVTQAATSANESASVVGVSPRAAEVADREESAPAESEDGEAASYFAVLTLWEPVNLSDFEGTMRENGDEWYYLPLEAFDSYLQNLESQNIDFQLEYGDADRSTALVIVKAD